ncbi:nuclear transport factor 2 family protein [Pseudooceanicola sp. LIPI14-2-Ac024]|uniref:nuclear transport factor 2 family protein n=1 Tax=Pseudooceanicola sp. LIPI14-2-Ac024 TaxID=3344875 RepID=UPI0035CF4B77
MADRTADVTAIAQLIQRWGLARDQGRWDELADCFTADGTISVTWFTGAFSDFIAASRRTYQPASPRVKHLVGVPVVDVMGDRALAETNIQILGRFAIEGVAVDNTSFARFLDRIVRTPGGWRIQSRVAIYEKDRLDPVVPGPAFDAVMAETDFSTVPEPYRFLGYRLLTSGRSLHPGIVCDGPGSERLLAAARDWLAG